MFSAAQFLARRAFPLITAGASVTDLCSDSPSVLGTDSAPRNKIILEAHIQEVYWKILENTGNHCISGMRM